MKLYEYSVGLDELGQEMIIAKFARETQYRTTSPITLPSGSSVKKKPIGWAGTMELHIHDLDLQNFVKGALGKKVDMTVFFDKERL